MHPPLLWSLSVIPILQAVTLLSSQPCGSMLLFLLGWRIRQAAARSCSGHQCTSLEGCSCWISGPQAKAKGSPVLYSWVGKVADQMEVASAAFQGHTGPLAWHAFLPCPQSLQAGQESHWQQRAPAVQEAVRTAKGLALLLCMQRLLQHAQEPWRRLRGRLHAPHTTVIRLRKERLCWRSSVQGTKCMSKLITPCAFDSSALQVLQV